MKVIILDAGSGNRLLPLTRDVPKCLLDMGNGTTILEHQLLNWARCGIDEVIVVGGFQIEKIRDAVKDFGYSGMSIDVLFNPHFNLYNNLYSLWIARDELDTDVIIMNGDVIFDYRLMQRMLRKQKDRVVLTLDRKEAYDQDDMKVQIRGGFVRAVTKIMRSDQANAESIGIMKFQNGGVALLRDTLQRLVNSEAGVHHFYLKAIQQMIDDGEKVGFLETRGLKWQEVDFPHDLKTLRREVHLFPIPEWPMLRIALDDRKSDHYRRRVG